MISAQPTKEGQKAGNVKQEKEIWTMRIAHCIIASCVV
jgi:hypothetical protein